MKNVILIRELFLIIIPMYCKKLNLSECFAVIIGLIIVRNFVRTSALPNQSPTDDGNVVNYSFEVPNIQVFEDKVLGSKRAIIVHFYAPWSKTSQLLAPKIEEAVNTLKGKILLAKVNIDHNAALTIDYEIHALPLIIVFKDGKWVEKIHGGQEVDKLIAFVKKHADD